MAKVKLYGKPMCHGCELAKTFLDSKLIHYDYLSIETDDRSVNIARKKELFALGAKNIPVLIIEGQEPIVGFDIDKYLEATRGM